MELCFGWWYTNQSLKLCELSLGKKVKLDLVCFNFRSTRHVANLYPTVSPPKALETIKTLQREKA